ncbi:MAG: L,D-transpeptidase [Butyrivibrio sp.]|nr:L,D-transpeptidase [Muribaculum sp.]MCM1553335.1 L,D-transpeptidase [Butyrivibrio sp.]
MKKTLRGMAFGGIIIIFLLAVSYIGLALYYREGFTVNTWINGVYCTGRSVQEVNGLLLEGTEAPESFTVTGYDRTGIGREKTSWRIPMESLKFAFDYETELRRYLAEQNAWLWAGNLSPAGQHELKAAVIIDEEALREQWEEILSTFYVEEDYCIKYDETRGYTLSDGLQGRLDDGLAYTLIREAILDGQVSVDLVEQGCYFDVPLSEEQQATEILWRQISFFQENGPVCDYGDGVTQADSALMAGLLVKGEDEMPITDENGWFVLREHCVEEWVESIADAHDTYNKEWEFQSTRGDIVHVKGGTYGTTIDRAKEREWLTQYMQQLLEQTVVLKGAGGRLNTQVHIPEYSRDAFSRSSKDFGGTYIEVDMGIQKLYYYEQGILKLETGVVTGNARRRMNTPEGVNYVYSKQKNRILRGEGYASPVKFWMPVKGAIGIHDANWRKDSEFGGDTYKTNGSHGCINVQQDVMKELFEMVEIGTPVVMFYGED